jgi:cold-inducible RNA-binding protein
MMSAFVPCLGRLAVLSRASAYGGRTCAGQVARSQVVAGRAAFSTNKIAMQMGEDEDSELDMDMDRGMGGGRGGEGGGEGGGGGVEETKLFVGNLSWNTTDSSLGDAFSEFGEVIDSKVVTDRFTGKSRGFGFITFADPDSADTALEQMNGQEVDGRSIRIDRANKRVGGGGPPRGAAPRRNFY